MSSPQIIKTPAEMTAWSEAARARGERIAFVPTMGALHAGHVSLLSAARKVGDRVVLSIFVNPTQFGPKEDLARYPRDLDGDLAKAASVGTDVAFVPEAKDMYPAGAQTFIEVREVSQGARQAALQPMKRAVELDPRERPPWLELAELQRSLGQAKDARQTLVDADQAAPSK